MLPSIIQLLKKDARHFQILSLSSFLLLGIFLLGWDSDYVKYAILFSSVLFFQYCFSNFNNLSIDSLKSAVITGLGLCLLFYSHHWIMYVCAAFFAIAGKFILKYNGKHFINPANFGICASILCFQDAWITPGQWGSTVFLFIIISLFGFSVLYKAQRLDIGLLFLVSFLSLDFAWNILYKSWPLDFFLHQSFNGALLLFSFFMITDPCSTPNHKYGRILFAIIVACLSFYLANFKFIVGAPIWALFFLSPLTPLIDYFLLEKKFQWTPKIIQNNI